MPQDKSLATLPTPQHLTLLFKYDKSTTFLSILPSQTLSEVKAYLLDVLASREITKFPGSSIPLPSDPEQLEFGITKDRRDGRDPSKGWVNAEDPQALASNTKGVKRKAVTTKDASPAETFADLDLKDGSYIAYRLRTGIDDMIDEEAVDENAGMPWNVIIPSFDDDDEMEEAVNTNTGDGDDEEGDDAMDIPVPVPRNSVR